MEALVAGAQRAGWVIRWDCVGSGRMRVAYPRPAAAMRGEQHPLLAERMPALLPDGMRIVTHGICRSRLPPFRWGHFTLAVTLRVMVFKVYGPQTPPLAD